MTFADAVKKAMNKRSMDAKDLVEKSGVNAPLHLEVAQREDQGAYLG